MDEDYVSKYGNPLLPDVTNRSTEGKTPDLEETLTTGVDNSYSTGDNNTLNNRLATVLLTPARCMACRNILISIHHLRKRQVKWHTTRTGCHLTYLCTLGLSTLSRLTSLLPKAGALREHCKLPAIPSAQIKRIPVWLCVKKPCTLCKHLNTWALQTRRKTSVV